MHLDPDVIRAKPRLRVLTWLAYAAADSMYDDFRADEAQAAIDRKLGGA
jgi:hypothetical protein